MHKVKALVAAVALACAASPAALAQSATDIKELRDLIRQMKEDYETRIKALERRLSEAESRAGETVPPTAGAEAAVATAPAAAPVSENAFNPAISLILQGRYANLSKNPDSFRINGFIPTGGEVDPGKRNFSLSESELNISASVDPYFSGWLTAALTPDNEVEVEEAYLRSLSLPAGFALKGGRFFSDVGYLNQFHQHAWDFIDPPLPYRAFLGRQLGDDGVQLKWVAPTELFLEIGTEAGRGRDFPGSDRNKNGVPLGTVFTHLGGDLGASHSWRAGLSYLRTSPEDRGYEDEDSTGTLVNNAFSGTSKLWIADLVWKWAPQGNPTERNFKFQAEYFRRTESGRLRFDADAASVGPVDDSFSSSQSGFYVQGVYQFMPAWRVGTRFDRLDHGTVNIGQVLNGSLTRADFPVLSGHNPTIATAMIDWSPTEFSRVRLQFARDKSRQGETDNQIFLQYILSLGSHGAHKW